jgi:hypothetical protein
MPTRSLFQLVLTSFSFEPELALTNIPSLGESNWVKQKREAIATLRGLYLNGGNPMFYIHILNQPPRQQSNPKIRQSTLELKQNSLVQHHQAEVKRIRQRTVEHYHLQRRLFN